MGPPRIRFNYMHIAQWRPRLMQNPFIEQARKMMDKLGSNCEENGRKMGEKWEKNGRNRAKSQMGRVKLQGQPPLPRWSRRLPCNFTPAPFTAAEPQN